MSKADKQLFHARTVEEIKQAAESGANINALNKNGVSRLNIAVKRYDYEIVKTLLSLGADIKSTDSSGLNAFGTFWNMITGPADIDEESAAETGRLLIEAGAEVNMQDSEGMTPLMHAADLLPQVIPALLEEGAAKTVRAVDHTGMTAIMYAAEDRSKLAPESIRSLIAAGADVNTVQQYSITALMEALIWGNDAGAEALLDAGANVTAVDRYGRSAIHSACENRSYLIPRLLDAGADVNAAGPEGETPLMEWAGAHSAYSMREFQTEFSEQEALSWKKLMEAGADPNKADDYGMTAAMYAACAGDKPTLKGLIAAGADMSLKDAEGKTALDYIKSRI